MGKTSGYSGGTVNINGQTKAKSYKKGNTVYTDYYMNDDEKRAYDFAQKSFADNLPNVNVFDAGTQKKFNEQLDAYTQKGQKVIEETYTPMLDSLKSDIARRFGNYDNSAFMDNLNKIENKRADSYAALAQDVLLQRDNLINNELMQRYQYLDYLQSVYNNFNNNATGFMKQASANSSSGNNYNSYANSRNSYADYFNTLAKTAINAYLPM